MIYNTGTIDTTSGINMVTGNGTNWTTLTTISPIYFLSDKIDSATYEVAYIQDATTLYLTENSVDTINAASYFLTTAFTPKYTIPLLTANDQNIENSMNTIFLKSEHTLLNFDTDNTTIPTGTGSGQYTTGMVIVNDSCGTQIIGYKTDWTELTTTNTMYFKRASDVHAYTIDSIVDATTLTLTENYTLETDLGITVYDDTSTYYYKDIVTFQTTQWECTNTSSNLNTAPIVTYDSTTYYTNGNTVLYDTTSYIYVPEEDTTAGITPGTNEDYWRIATINECAAASLYWDLYNGEPYQIVYDTTPNYGLPLLAHNDEDIWIWFSFGLKLLDATLFNLL